MELFFDTKVQGLALLGITRSVLTASGGGVLPLPGLSFESFMAASWDELRCAPEQRAQVGLALARMFPPAGVEAGELGSAGDFSAEMTLRGVFNRSHGPAALMEFVSERWRACSGRKNAGRVVFMSSGSTGKPKAAAHSWPMLMQELEAVMPLFPPLRRALTLTPLQHCYGFMFGVLAALSFGLRREVLPPFPPMVREALAPGDLVVGFPDFWRNMPHQEQSPPEGVFCLSATAPWPEAEQRALRDSGYSQSLEIFGSSENGVIGWRSHPDDPFELLPYWSRDPDTPAVLLRTLPGGEKQRLPLQDDFKWEGERRFRPAGRSDNAVQVSGVNVYPAHIARLIGALPGVSACKVRLMRPGEGHRLKAFVVPADGWPEEKLSPVLKAFFHEKLGAPERPASITFGPSLPKTMYGKDSDW